MGEGLSNKAVNHQPENISRRVQIVREEVERFF